MTYNILLQTDENSPAMQQSGSENDEFSDSEEPFLEDRWVSVDKSEVPERSYTQEFLITVLVPLVIMLILALVVSFILCFHHEGM